LGTILTKSAVVDPFVAALTSDKMASRNLDSGGEQCHAHLVAPAQSAPAAGHPGRRQLIACMASDDFA
jgi:hypothetical protein